MKRHFLTVLVIVLLMLAAAALPAAADGVVVITPPDSDPPQPMPAATPGKAPVVGPMPPLPPPQPPYLSVKYHRVEVSIRDQVALTKVDQVFVNDYNVDLEGTYIFPLPEDAAISNFSMYVDGKKWEGKLLTKEEARRIYEDTVRSKRDPALLEYIGRGAFQARVYPIPARGERRIQIEYTQVLPRENDLVRYIYPLATEKLSPQALKQLSVHVTVSGREAIKSVYSASHDIVVTRKGETTVEASYEATNIRPDRDFVLYYSLAGGDMGASLLTYRPAGEDGYFLLLVTPRSEVEAASIAAKDVILALDISGSMQGQKITQAKSALLFVLDRLNAQDRFAVITFNTGVDRFGEGLMTVQDRDAARRHVGALVAAGGTNINDALLEALKGIDTSRPTTVIFLTDGLPTAGVVDANRILANVSKTAAPNVRLFTFGVGYDVNTALLDKLASDHRGASAYVKPGENLEEAVSTFYAKISRPVLTDISLDFGGIRVADLYPTPLPDLFAGGQLVLVGRYRNSGAATVTLKGLVNGKSQQFAYSNLSFPQLTGSDTAFIARLWATRRIGYLLTQMRLNGSNKELIDEVTSLSLRYGIVTSYTSYLVDERQNVFAPGAQQKASESLGRALPTAPAAPTPGPAAVQDSQALRALRDAPAVSSVPQGVQAQARVQTVADKTFLLRDGVWVDTEYREAMKTVVVGFGSADYFALLAARPEWGKYFALSQKVIVALDGAAYRVDEGQFPAIDLPASPTPAATPVTGPSQPAASENPLLRLWRWLMGLVTR